MFIALGSGEGEDGLISKLGARADGAFSYARVLTDTKSTR